MRPTLRVTIDLSTGGVENVHILADTPADRDICLDRLKTCMPILEMLEQELQKEAGANLPK